MNSTQSLDILLSLLMFKEEEIFLSVLLWVFIVFLVLTVFLFLMAAFLRIKNKITSLYHKFLKKNWDAVILKIMYDEMHPYDGFKKLRRKHSLSYLFHIEEYIDLLKGKEKDRLMKLGRMSLKNIYKLLRSKDTGKQIYGIHFIGLFHPEEQYKFLMVNSRDMNMTMTAIKEMHAAKDIHIKEQLVRMLLTFPYISYIYISNLLVEMGPDIVPFLRQVIEKRHQYPHEQMIAIETVRRMKIHGCLDLGEKVLLGTEDPGVMACWCKYIEDQKDVHQLHLVIPLMEHEDPGVRTAATRAFLVMADKIDSEIIKKIFNDRSVMVAVNAYEILKGESANMPYLSVGSIEKLKWADIYKEIL